MKTNADKFLKDGVDKKEFATAIAKRQVWWSSDAKEHFAGIVNDIIMFLDEEVKPTLTEDERVILRNLPREWKYINRIDGRICIKQELEDSTNLGINYLFPDLFQFIKERRRI